MTVSMTSQQSGIRNVNRILQHLFCMLTFIAVMSMSKAAWAETDGRRLSALASVTESELEQLRGRFRTPEGLEINLGITKLTMTNGQLRNGGSIDMQVLTRDSDATSAQGVEYVSPDLVGGLLASLPRSTISGVSFMQNALDDQLIQNISIVDIRVSNLFTIRSRLSMSRWIAESAREF